MGGIQRNFRGYRPSRTLQAESLEPRTLLAANTLLPDSVLVEVSRKDDTGGDVAVDRSIDGTGNNRKHPEWGSVDQALLRLVAMEYADDIAAPAGPDRYSARMISNAVVAQSESVVNHRGLSDFVWMWGQFIDHDIDLTGSVAPAEPFDIQVPMGDDFFDPEWTGVATISLSRSLYDHETGVSSPRLQINEITAFIDGSVIYGSDARRAAELRLFRGGLLKTSDGGLLPFNAAGLDNAGGTSASLFLAGDVRANENVALSSLHTLWVREHNRWAEKIAADNPKLSDEKIFARAKSIVVAELQAITYNEFLPALLGSKALRPYKGYRPKVNPGISNIFSTAAYRFGHSMLSPDLQRLESDGSVSTSGNLPLRDAFFSPQQLIDNGIDSLLMGAAHQRAQEVDTLVVDDVRCFLFGPPGSGGFDLAALNIQRGRDHGLADYNQARRDLGLKPVKDFKDITSDVELQDKLREMYGTVDDIDVWVGGLAEDHVKGSSVGELVRTVLVDQFERLRDGDRFWYQNVFSGDRLRKIEQTTLADVIQRNTEVKNLQENIFFMPDQHPNGPGGAKPGRPKDLTSAPIYPAPPPTPVKKAAAAASTGDQQQQQDTIPQPAPGPVRRTDEPSITKRKDNDVRGSDTPTDKKSGDQAMVLLRGLAALLKKS